MSQLPPLERLVVFVEEPSMEAAISLLLPKVFGEDGPEVQIITFSGKPDLLKKLPSRLASYARWLPSAWRILVLIDRDDDNCIELKQTLETIATAAGLTTRSIEGAPMGQVINRVVCEELEAWYLGDPDALAAAYPRMPTTLAEKRALRDPDSVKGGTHEALWRELKKRGYHTTALAKVQLARDVCPHMTLERNRSRSFQVLVEALQDLV